MERRTSSKPGRWRFRLGLALLTAGVALALLLAVSAKWWFGYGTATWVADLGDGTLYTQSMVPNNWSRPLIGWCGGINGHRAADGSDHSWTWTWWTWGERKANWEKGLAYSVWPIAPLVILCGAALFWPVYRAARRLRHDQCVHCGYSRAGLLPQGPCPECGRQQPDP